MATYAHEDYLKAVYTLSETLERVTTSALADHLDVRPSSVTAMVKKLSAARPRLLDYKSHRGVALTKAGRRVALNMVRRHRLIEQFLVEILGFGWESVHDEADRLEHCVSDLFIDKLDARLGFPARGPHGRPIPGKSGEIPAVDEIRLSDVPLHETVRVASVGSEEPEFLSYMSDIGLKPNVVVQVSEIAKVGETISVDLLDGGEVRERVVSVAFAEKIFVTRDP